MVDTTDEWIEQRSGIKQRHIAAESEKTSDMATKAAQKALSQGGFKPEDIDGVIVATTTPDYKFPAVAVQVQNALGIPPCAAFDVQAVCTGFVYALATADGLIKNGTCSRILVIGAEKMSSIVDWNDRTTCVLFADGAGAAILEKSDAEDKGIISTHLYGDGSGLECLYAEDKIIMQGREVFKVAVTNMASVVEEALAQNNLQPTDIDWLVPHQANLRIIDSTAKKLGMPMEKVVVTVDRHGNTSAASIPLALDEAMRDGRIKKGQTLLLEAMGGGFTWGAALIKY